MLTASTPGDGTLRGLPATDLPGPAHHPESFPAHLLRLVPAPRVHLLVSLRAGQINSQD